MKKIFLLLYCVTIYFCFTKSLFSQWQLDRNSSVGYEYVSVLDSSKVFAVGSKSSRYICKRNANGTWDSITTNGIDPDKYITCIAAKDEQKIWVGDAIGGSSGANLYSTTNAGLNWLVQLNSGGSDDFFNGLQFSRSNPSFAYGWSSPPFNNGNPIKVYKTANSGNSWNEYSIVPEPFYTGHRPAICVTDSDHAWFALNKSIGSFDTVKILYTSDGGQNFNISKLPILGYWVSAVTFKNDNLFGIATVYFQNNYFLKTFNGGISWQIYTTPHPLGNSVKLISIPNSRTWYAATDIMDTLVGKSFYKSTDNGDTWIPMSYPYYEQTRIKYMDGISYGNKVYLYAVSTSGKIFRLFETVTLNGINNISTEIPSGFLLKQNFPNPFNPVTNINFDIPLNSFVKLKIFDVTGKLIFTLVDKNLPAGGYKVDFDGSHLSSGVYFYKLEVGSFIDTKRMILLK